MCTQLNPRAYIALACQAQCILLAVSSPPLRLLGEVLAERALPVLPILSAIEESGAPTVYLAISGFSNRIDLLVPFLPASLAAIAPQIAVPSIPPRAMLRISADGDRLGAAMVVVGAMHASDALDDVSPAGGREPWRATVDALLAPAGGLLSSRTRSLTEARGAIAIRYADRAVADDLQFQAAISAAATPLGISVAQQSQWRTLHAANGSGAAVTVATQCTDAGPISELGFLYRTSSWDQAITLTKLIAADARARTVAATFGMLAGRLQIEQISGVEFLLRDGEPDLVAWATLAVERAA